MNVREDDLCRICGKESESREHLLFECEEVADEIRNVYVSKVCTVLECSADDLSLDRVLSMEGKLGKEKVQKLAVVLWSYLKMLDYKA